MIREKITITIPGGLHMRPVGMMSKKATEYRCKVEFHVKGEQINVKSVLSVLGACICAGQEIELVCDGEDEREAFDALREMILSYNEMAGDIAPGEHR